MILPLVQRESLFFWSSQPLSDQRAKLNRDWPDENLQVAKISSKKRLVI